MPHEVLEGELGVEVQESISSSSNQRDRKAMGVGCPYLMVSLHGMCPKAKGGMGIGVKRAEGIRDFCTH